MIRPAGTVFVTGLLTEVDEPVQVCSNKASRSDAAQNDARNTFLQ